MNECVKTFEMLQQSEMKYSKVFNDNPAAMILSDTEKVVDINESFVKLTVKVEMN